MNLTIKDILSIVGPPGTLMLIMWYHVNSSIHNLRRELKELIGELKGDIKELSGKIDGIHDHVSRIEVLLIFVKIMPAGEIKPKEEVTDQKEVVEDTKGATVSHAAQAQAWRPAPEYTADSQPYVTR